MNVLDAANNPYNKALTGGFQAPQFSVCDLDGDGFLSINLPELKDAEALGVQDPIFFDVTYHNTLDDANADRIVILSKFVDSKSIIDLNSLMFPGKLKLTNF